MFGKNWSERIAKDMLRRVSVTGPESTGKTRLAEWLAGHYQTQWVPEYAREYLAKHGPDYTLEDVAAIAHGQLKRENTAVENAREILFCDTDLLVTKIWCEVVFGLCPEWIEQQFRFVHINTICIYFATRIFRGSRILYGKIPTTGRRFLNFT